MKKILDAVLKMMNEADLKVPLPFSEMVSHFKDVKMVRLGDISFIEDFSGFKDRGFERDAINFLKAGHCSELNKCQPNCAPLSFDNIKRLAHLGLLNKPLLSEVIVAKVEGDDVLYAIGSRHTCVLISLVYGFDVEVPVSLRHFKTITDAKKLSLDLNNTRRITRVENSTTIMPLFVQDADPSREGWGTRLKSRILGIKNSGIGNEHRETQSVFLRCLISNIEHLGNPEYGISKNDVLKELGMKAPYFTKPPHKSGIKGEGVTGDELVSYLKEMTSIRGNLNLTPDEMFKMYVIQIDNACRLYNAYCISLDKLKQEAIWCYKEENTPPKVRDACDSFIKNIGAAYSSYAIAALGKAADVALYGCWQGPNSRHTKYADADINGWAMMFANAAAGAICAEVAQTRSKLNAWAVVFLEKVLSLKGVDRRSTRKLEKIKVNMIQSMTNRQMERMDAFCDDREFVPWAKAVKKAGFSKGKNKGSK